MSENLVRVNVGSGLMPLPGYINIDQHEKADIQMDFRDVLFDNPVDEIVASHILEHLGWREIHGALDHLHGWLRPDGLLTIEVPDMETMMADGTDDLSWISNVYGVQSHDGEYHKCGFTRQFLIDLLEAHDFRIIRSRTFRSGVSYRVGYPCLEVVARRKRHD